MKKKNVEYHTQEYPVSNGRTDIDTRGGSCVRYGTYVGGITVGEEIS